MPNDQTMIIGILNYGNPSQKNASRNIGDWVQSIAQMNVLSYLDCIYKATTEFPNQIIKNLFYKMKKPKRLVVKNPRKIKLILVNRDNLSSLKKRFPRDNVWIIMNGWWMHPFKNNGDIDFPPPSNVRPILTSFHIADERILNRANCRDYLIKWGPVGARDLDTYHKLQQKGIPSFFSGCLTLNIDTLFSVPVDKNSAVYIVDTNLLKSKQRFVKKIKYVKQKKILKYKTKSKKVIKKIVYKKVRKVVKIPEETKVVHSKNIYRRTPLTNFITSYNLLKKYAAAKHIYTSRLHCFLPSLSLGASVTFQSPQGDPNKTTWGSKDRFNGLRELINSPHKRKNVAQNLRHSILNMLACVLDQGSKDQGSDEVGSKDQGSDEVGSKDQGSKDQGSDEVGSKDQGSDEVGSKDQGSKDQKNIISENTNTTEENQEAEAYDIWRWQAEEYDAHSGRTKVLGMVNLKDLRSKINIVFCADKNFVKLVPTVLNSISINNPHRLIIAYLIAREVPIEELRRLEILIGTKFEDSVRLHIIEVDDNVNYDTHLKHVTVATMDRLRIPSLLPETVKKVIYLDLDLIVNCDLASIYNMKIPACGIVGRSSLQKDLMKSWIEMNDEFVKYSKTFSNKKNDKFKISKFKKSLNAGVLLMDLEKLRANKFEEEVSEWVEKFGFNDQIVINIYCQSNYGELNPKFNVFAKDENKVARPAILHYAGSKKPWLPGFNHKRYQKMWDKYYIKF
jgi:lipopolysaccharide biosynthesis glycosyltransferase